MNTGSLGLDLGSVNVKAAWLPRREGAHDAPAFVQPSRGQPLAALESLVESQLLHLIGKRQVALSLTGIGQSLLGADLPATTTNEVVATALAVADAYPGTRTVIDVGGQFTKWILLDGDRVADSAINGLCAAGSGAFLEQQAARLKLTADEMGRLAYSAKRGAPVAGRCSVFAKSDMIHLQQKGTPVEEIAYGVCQALVRTFVATVLGGREVEPPLVIVGGGGANPGLVRAFSEVLGLEEAGITVPPDHTTIGARGAALAVDEHVTLSLDELRRALRSRIRSSRRSIGSAAVHLPSLAAWSVQHERRDENPPRPAADAGPTEAYLGVDVGSVSTNIVVVDPQGDVLQGIYLPTRGRPMAVLDEALTLIEEKFGDDLEVLAVGATGSGRHLAARSLGADTVKNEITAQMASSANYFPDVDTVFEIGGQDSKYIGAREGRLASFEMNKICAAGTGSFLEEQADRLGVSIRGEFSELALQAEAPRDLGSRCTVFMDTELVRAQQLGISTEDICAGLAYSIARNYLEKVVAHRPVGRRVVFQGGTASNDAVVAAMRALTNKDVVVHPYNRISGAIGAALLAARDYQREPHQSAFRGYAACRDAQTRSFECKRCANRCQVIRVTVGGQVSHFGDTCERYSARDDALGHHAQTLPPRDLFAEREALLKQHLPPRRPGRQRVVIPRASHFLELAPLWATAFDHLGFDVSLTEPSALSQIELGSSGLPNEYCLPIKLASGHVRRALAEDEEALVLYPSVLELPDPAKDGQTHPCLYSQELPNVLRHAEGERVLVPQSANTTTRGGLVETVSELQRLLGVSRRRARKALDAGVKVQKRFIEARQALGQEMLRSYQDRAIVVLGRPYNIHDPLLNLDLAKRLSKLGLVAIPMDMLPTNERRLDEAHKNLMWRYSRDQLRALDLVLDHHGLFPLWVSCFGCGLDAFAFKHIEGKLGDRPALMLEFDEHRGEAGLVTRLEAFVDEIDEYLAERPCETPPPPRHRHVTARSRRVFIPNISDHAEACAAALQSVGLEATVLPLADEETVKLGEEASSGGECHPWTVMTGELVRWVKSGEGQRGDIFYYPQANNPCLIGQYGDGHRHVLERLGVDERYHIIAIDGARLVQTFGGQAASRMYEGIAATDILIAASCARRPYELTPGSVDRVHRQNIARICDALNRGETTVDAMRRSFEALLAVPANTEERRPLVGVCGDFYTRINACGNANLFARLEALGCQVWPHPYLAGLVDGATRLFLDRWIERGQLGEALLQFIAGTGTDARSRPLFRVIPEELRELCLTPEPREMRRLAAPYTGPRTNNLVAENVARIVDYAERGADGVISAVGVGCMVGVAVDGAMRRIRCDYPDIPMVTLAYSCSEGPAQRIKLETFVHQVLDRARSKSVG